MDAGFLGGLVQRADVGREGALLEARVPGQTWRVLLTRTHTTTPSGGRAHLAPLPGRGEDLEAGALGAGDLRALLGLRRRKELEGLRVVAATASSLTLARDERVVVLTARAGGVTAEPLPEAPVDAPPPPLAEAGPLVAAAVDGLFEGYRTSLRQALTRAEKRLLRRQAAIAEDVAKLERTQRLAALGPWLLAEAGKVPRGAKVLEAVDWSTGAPTPIHFPLDPAKGAREQVDALFRKAKRSKQGLAIAEGRFFAAEEELAAVRAALEGLGAATTLPELRALFDAAKAASPREVRAPAEPGARPRAATRALWRTFLAEDGTPLLVGKGPEGNDAVTLRAARPWDAWLHAKDRTGAHVVIALPRRRGGFLEHLPLAQLLDGAHLAAHFSDARDDAVVDVQYTERRYLRKPRGAARGLVLVDKEKVLPLRVDRARIAALLAREETDP